MLCCCAQAVSWCIDELKRRVVIWKKEWYADGSVWKENAEWREAQEAMRNQPPQQQPPQQQA